MFNLRQNHLLQAIIVIAIILLVLLLKAVIVVFFIAFLVTTFLHPLVGWLRRKHVPVGFAVFLPILSLALIVAAVVYFAAPQIARESGQFVDKMPEFVRQIEKHGLDLHINIHDLQSTLQDHFGTIGDALIGATKAAVEVVVGVVSIIVICLYWLGSYERVQQTLLSYVPKKSRARASDIWARVEKKLVSWVFAQVLLGLVVGLLTWIGAMILGLPFAGILGVIAGFLEVIPTLGPIAAAIPGVLLGFTISLSTVVGALIMYIAIQQIENHLLAPWLLGRTVRLSPIIIILSLLVGATLYGILGALLAVPVALVISAFVDSYRAGQPSLKPSSSSPNNLKFSQKS